MRRKQRDGLPLKSSNGAAEGVQYADLQVVAGLLLKDLIGSLNYKFSKLFSAGHRTGSCFLRKGNLKIPCRDG
ncbi:MAG: hypothetical protein ACM3N7_03345 [Planctomycetaceae bacterium]